MIRGLGLLVWLRRTWRYREEFAGPGKNFTTTTGCEQAVVADAVKAPWQDMQEKPADELVGPERHDLLALSTEMSRHVLAYNMKRVIAILGTGPLMQTIPA
jgi:hypothetical protein